MDNQIAIQFSDTIKNIATAAKGFQIEIAEADFVHGPTVTKTLTVNSCTLSTQEKTDDTLILTLNAGFSNASGNIRVVYDALLGGLYGAGGVVESFDKTFIPVGLTPNMSANPREYLEARITSQATVIPILPVGISGQAEHFDAMLAVKSGVIPLTPIETGKIAREQFVLQISTTCKVTDLTNSIP